MPNTVGCCLAAWPILLAGPQVVEPEAVEQAVEQAVERDVAVAVVCARKPTQLLPLNIPIGKPMPTSSSYRSFLTEYKMYELQGFVKNLVMSSA